MKRMMSLLAFAALAASVQPAGAQMAGMSDQHAGHGDHAMPAAAPVEATGVIRAIDAKAASVTLAHEAIPALK
jgi:Cu(I)/Ag(I) efflux system periplasmic protein CusF